MSRTWHSSIRNHFYFMGQGSNLSPRRQRADSLRFEPRSRVTVRVNGRETKQANREVEWLLSKGKLRTDRQNDRHKHLQSSIASKINYHWDRLNSVCWAFVRKIKIKWFLKIVISTRKSSSIQWINFIHHMTDIVIYLSIYPFIKVAECLSVWLSD